MIKVAYRACAYCLVLAYLYVQADSDARTGLVYKGLNTAALVVSAACYALAVLAGASEAGPLCFDLAAMGLSTVLFTFPFKKGRGMQPGDAKAAWVLYFSCALWGSPSFALYGAFGSLVVALLYSAWWKKSRKIPCPDGRVPLFPGLLVGHAVVGGAYWLVVIARAVENCASAVEDLKW